MGGSTLKFNLPENENLRHDKLINRESPMQHPLQSSYRTTDGKDLDTILKEINIDQKTVLSEEIQVLSDGTTIIDLTKFSYNMIKDSLYVSVGGFQVFEGTENDYVKTTPKQIQFNYILPYPITVYILLLGTISNISFGDDVYSALSKFTQLTDTPSQYHGSEGKYPKVNETGTGLIFDTVKASNDLIMIEYNTSISSGGYYEGWIPFVKSGIIKGIKVIGEDSTTVNIQFSLWTGPNSNWVYYSGNINNILWDIMDIPFIDESGQNCIYARLDNLGISNNYKIQIYLVL